MVLAVVMQLLLATAIGNEKKNLIEIESFAKTSLSLLVKSKDN